MVLNNFQFRFYISLALVGKNIWAWREVSFYQTSGFIDGFFGITFKIFVNWSPLNVFPLNLVLQYIENKIR